MADNSGSWWVYGRVNGYVTNSGGTYAILKFSSSNIETYNTTQNDVLKSEKVVLSVEGEERAKTLGNLDIFNNIDVIYASNCVRTLETAKYLLSRLNLKVNLDERFDERRFGIPNSDKYPDWFRMQYFDQAFKTEGGESQEDVRNRVNEAFNEVFKVLRDAKAIRFGKELKGKDINTYEDLVSIPTKKEEYQGKLLQTGMYVRRDILTNLFNEYTVKVTYRDEKEKSALK